MPKARPKPIIDPNHLGQEGSINELLGQPILKDSLDSMLLAIKSSIKDLNLVKTKGLTANHRELLVWQVLMKLGEVANLLDKVTESHNVSQEKK